MANLVSLEIRAQDLTGPGFLSVLARAEALKKALQDAGNIDVNASGIDATLSAVKSKLQAHGIADLLDVNLSQGQISAQLMMLKRRISDAKIGDLLDVNLNAAAAQAQISRLAHDIEASRIPLTITPYVLPPDMSRVTWSQDAAAALAALGPSADQASAGVAGLGPVLGGAAGDAALLAGMADADTVALAKAAAEAGNYSAAARILAVAAKQGSVEAAALAAALAPRAGQAGRFGAAAALTATAAKGGGGGGAGGGITGGLISGAGWRGWLPTGNASLFAGMFGTTPILGAIGAVHLLAEAVIEFAAVAIPAGVAFGMFGIAAIPTLQEIYQQMSALRTVTTAFSDTQYPLAGGFTAIADAARPAVMQLWGDALVIAGAKQGAFMTLVKQTGPVLDQLGNRTAAALQGGGLGAFFKNGAADLAKFGDMAGNVFGTIGNLLKTMPGYAEIILSAFDNLSKGLEAVSASPVTQWIIGAGLAVHGFVIWAGLAVTGVVILGNALGWLAGKAGLTGLAMGAFNGAAFKTAMVEMGVAAEAAGVNILSIGTSMIQSGINTVFGTSLGATAMQKEAVAAAELAVAQATAAGDAAGLAVAEGVLAAASDAAGASISALDGVMAVFDAITPMGWVLIATAALGGLVYWLTQSGRATTLYTDAVKTAFQSTPVSQFTLTATAQQTALAGQLADATKALGSTQEYTTSQNVHTGQSITMISEAWLQAQGTMQGVKNAQALLSAGQKNYNTLLGVAGGNQAILNNAGLTSQQILTDTGQALAQDKIAVMASADAWKSMSLGVGQNAAAVNALTGEYMNQTLPALQKVTTAEDAVMSAVLSGMQATISAGQAVMTAGTDFQAYGKKLDGTAFSARNLANMTGGLNTAQLTAANDFYSTVLPAYQKQTDALQQQGISVRGLTGIIADNARVMLQMAGSDITARTAMVDYINNALGPGTVSLSSLDSWTKKNSVSLSTYNGFVSQAAINASNFASTLANVLTPQLATVLAQQGHVNDDLKTYASDLLTSGANSRATQADRSKLIGDLFNLGLNFQQINAQLKAWNMTPMTNKSATVTVAGGDTGLLTASGTVVVPGQGPIKANGYMQFHQAGGLIGGNYGIDQNLAMLTKDEIVFPAWAKELATPLAKKLRLPGFASGGLVGGVLNMNAANNAETWMQGQEVGWATKTDAGLADSVMTTALSGAIAAILQAALQAAVAAAASARYVGGAGAPSGIGAVNANLALRLHPGISSADWNAWNFVSMRECLPLRTRILTRRGWLTHDEVRVGDETIGYNQRVGRSEWTKVTRVVRYGQAETMRFGNAYWSAECTPGHRWLTERMFVDSRSRAESVRGERLLELRHRERLDRVILARAADLAGSLPITLNEAALLGWVAGDGNVWEPKRYMRRGRPVRSGPSDGAPFGYRLDGEPKKNRSGRPRSAQPGHTYTVLRLTVVQSKPEHFAAIDQACSDAPRVGKVTARTRWRDLHFWNLGTDYSKDLLARAGHPKRDAVAQVLAMSSAQRAAWLEAITRAEGTTGGGKTVIYQNDGPVADAIELAIYLSGHRPSRTKDTRGEARNWAIRSTAPTIGGPNRNSFVRDAGYQDVWCVTTESGSWTAEQDGQIFLTGNSGWNNYASNPSSGAYGIPQALPFTKMPKAAWPGWAGGYSDPVSQENWMWSYMAGRYGGPQGAAAHEAAFSWYDSGGWLPPGLSMAYNGTGQPERVSPPGGGAITLEIAGGSQTAFDQFMLNWLRKTVRVKGGGSVQNALGRNG